MHEKAYPRWVTAAPRPTEDQQDAAALRLQRRRLVEEAAEARGKGKRKRAIELYRELLTLAPDDCEVHGKLAQLLAEGGDIEAASQSFRAGALGYHEKGFTDRAIALLKQAVVHAPLDVEAWLSISAMYVVRDKHKDAHKALDEARPHFTKRDHLSASARILDAHLRLEPRRVDLAVDRARVAKRQGQRGYGILLLTDLLAAVEATDRKRLRRALFWLRPTPASLWRWLRNTPAA